MNTTRKVAVFVGSLRKGSYNRVTAKALAAFAPTELELEIVEIGQLPVRGEIQLRQPPGSERGHCSVFARRYECRLAIGCAGAPLR